MIAARYYKVTLLGALCTAFVAGCQTPGAVTAGVQTTSAEAPKVGDPAPPLTLDTLDGKREVNLASFHHKRPVALFFGSYT